MDETWVTTIFASILISLIIGVLPAYIASNKGKNFFTWYIYGVLLFFFAMIHAIALPEETGDLRTTAQDIKEGRVPLKFIPAPLIYKDPLLVVLKSPADLISYEIKVLQDSSATYASIKLLNISDKTISAVKLRLYCYDAFNEPAGKGSSNIIEISIQDLKARPRNFFADDGLIVLPGLEDTRKIKVAIIGVLFADGNKWSYNKIDLIEVITEVAEGYNLESLKRLAGKDAICYAKEEKSYWQCICGRVNVLGAEECSRCVRNKRATLMGFNSKESVDLALKIINEKQEEEERLRQEKLKKKREEAKQKRLLVLQNAKKISAVAAVLLVVIIAIALVYQNIIKPPNVYRKAVALMEAGDYGEAAVIFLQLGDYRDSEEMLLSEEMLIFAMLAATNADYYIDYENGTIPIGDLPIGARVVDPSWEWEFRAGRGYAREEGDQTKLVTWIVVSKNHYSYSELGPHITLLTEELIGRNVFCVDQRSHWGKSDLRVWLNSQGFKSSFSGNFKNAVMTTNVPNKDWQNGSAYNTKDQVFIPSATELGYSDQFWANQITERIGTIYPYFQGANDEKRAATLGDEARWYWTRSPKKGYSVLDVNVSGEFYEVGSTSSDGGGVRPALNLKSEISVSEIKR